MTATEVPAARTERAGSDPAGPEPGVRTLRAPATRDQVDAHRFGQRRMEAALVRADPVPLHEQLRSQRRATFAGVLLGLLGLGGAALIGSLTDAHDWEQQALVVGDRSGTVYAVTPPDPGGSAQRLVPVANTMAGRMVRAAMGAPAPEAVPETVSEEKLAAARRTPPATVAGAVGVRPDGPAVPPDWAVCDTDPDPGSGGSGTTTVLAGSLGPSTPAPGMLLATGGGSTSVVLDGVRHRVDPDDRPALSALGLIGVPARQVGDGVLSAIPEGAPLRTPDLTTGSSDVEVDGLGRAGDVVVSNPLGGGEAFFVVLGARDGRRAGVLPVPATLADAIRASTGQGEPPVVAEGLVARNTLDGGLDTSGWPATRMTRTDPAAVPVVCVTWRDGRTGFSAGDRLPSVEGSVAVDLAAADGPGARLDTVVLPPGGAGPVVSRGSTGGGTRWLLSSSGALYGVADDRTAAALGVTTPGPAPDEMLRLLPRAGALDMNQVRDVADLPTPPN